MDFSHLRAVERPKDTRDILLGTIQAPAQIPAVFLPDNSWLTYNFQGRTPYCGEHAGTHFQAILDHYQDPSVAQRYSPRYGVIKMKTLSSPVYDGFPVEVGTSMTAIFKWLQKVGAASYEPLENDVTLPFQTYCDPSLVTPAIDADAANHKILSYAFDALTFPDLQQAIFQNKAVILLIHCDNGFWGTATPTFSKTPYTHYVVADGYTTNAIRVIDSAEPNKAFAVKMIDRKYVTPQFFLESGTAIDIPVAQLRQIVQDASQAVQVASRELGQPSATPQQRNAIISLLLKVAAFLSSLT